MVKAGKKREEKIFQEVLFDLIRSRRVERCEKVPSRVFSESTVIPRS